MHTAGTAGFPTRLVRFVAGTDGSEKGPDARRPAGRITIAALFLAALATMLAGCGGGTDETTVQPVVKTERLEIVDQEGATRAVLTTVEGGRPSLTLIDENGNYRAWLFLGTDGSPNLVLIDDPRLVLMDEAGEIRSAQRLDRNGAPVLTFADEAGSVRLMLRLDESNSPAIEFYSEDGEPGWSAP